MPLAQFLINARESFFCKTQFNGVALCVRANEVYVAVCDVILFYGVSQEKKAFTDRDNLHEWRQLVKLLLLHCDNDL